ncbi:unnamed protein product [Effrenium voratum]|nr:unnamed protein product [Effrenium voratum]
MADAILGKATQLMDTVLKEVLAHYAYDESRLEEWKAQISEKVVAGLADSGFSWTVETTLVPGSEELPALDLEALTPEGFDTEKDAVTITEYPTASMKARVVATGKAK